MDLIITLIDNFFNGLISDINDSIAKKKEKLTFTTMTSLKLVYLIFFTVCFLLGNLTSMLAVIFKDILGYGMIFPISSSVLLYILALISLKKIFFYKSESSFLEKKFKYDEQKENQ